MAATYDPWLVVLSILIAVVAAYTALDLASRVNASEGRIAKLWLSGGAFSMGLGIWSMHFIGMLAYHIDIPVAYDIPITFVSMIPAIAAAWLALYTIDRRTPNVPTLAISGTCMGLGITTMHYTGMAAMQMSPPIQYDPLLFSTSVVIAILASVAALYIAFELQRMKKPSHIPWHKLASASIMGLAIAGMHYTGMASMYIAPGSMCLSDPISLSATWLAVLVGGGSILILTATLLVSMFDARYAEQNARLVTELSLANEDLHARANELARTMTEELRANTFRTRLLATIVEQTSEAIITTDLAGLITSWNDAAKSMFGYTSEQVLNQPISRLFAEPVSTSYTDTVRNTTRGAASIVDLRMVSQTGQQLHVSATISPLFDEADIHTGEINIFRDTTSQIKANEHQRLAAAVFDNTTEGILITDDKMQIIAVNEAYTKITGYNEQEAIGKLSGFAKTGTYTSSFYQRMWDSISELGYWRGEYMDRRKNGVSYPKWVNISAVQNDQGTATNYVVIFSDISKIKESEDRLEHLSHHDPLTGLPNRLLLNERLERALIKAQHFNKVVAVVFLDLDRFKNVNDNLGHPIGDELLRLVTARLIKCVRNQDTVARIGGDEFVIVLENLRKVEDAAFSAKKILTVLADPFQLDGHEVYVTTSIGISVAPENGVNASLLIKYADTAMYKAKELGRNTYKYYSQDLSATALERFELESQMRLALQRDEFEVYYQPLYSLQDNSIISAEALIRWNHPDMGFVPPDRFIPLAEECDLIQSIGKWVLNTACKDVVRWKSLGLPPIKMAVNLSARQISNVDLVDMVKHTLQETGMRGADLELEITETCIMQHALNALRNIEALRKLQVSFAIDDFGTGYSSMGYLKRFPVQKLKIDRSFIKEISQDADSQAIAKAIIVMSHSLQLQVVAEGVETAQQRDLLKGMDCDLVQGYYYSRPIPAADFEQLLSNSILSEPEREQQIN